MNFLKGKLFLVLLGLVPFGLIAWHWFTCGNLAHQAEADLRESKPAALGGPLDKLLSQAKTEAVPTQSHPLMGKEAPDFTLTEVEGRSVHLKELAAKGPVVVVFYLGYVCDHCVSQLFGIDEDLAYFRELGATVVAISGDSAKFTKEQYAQYRPFHFDLLSDADRVVAQKFGVFTPETKDRNLWEAHGTFVIGRDGVVHWANTGKRPFTGNPTLLHEIAKLPK